MVANPLWADEMGDTGHRARDTQALDNAAAAALYRIEREPVEHMGALFGNDDGSIGRTDTISRGMSGRVKGTLSVPTGRLRALFHNHPPAGSKSDVFAERFSDDDIAKARQLRTPSYITTAAGKVLKFDPLTNSTTEVLAEFPWEEQRRRIMIEILERDVNDPRGLRR